MSYEQWDAIADAYTPALGLLCLLSVLQALLLQDRRLAAIRAMHLSARLLIAYGLMFLDHAFTIWARAGLDYSTHAAVSLVLVTYLRIHVRKLWVFWDVSLIMYFVLIVYQQYHSAGDLLTTTAAAMVSLYVSLSLLKWLATSHKPDAS